MEKRQRKILNSIIKEYQRTGQPVSSQSLLERFVFNFSPATMRSEMLELDETGFLEQPHTSAGRVPTDKAYRLFIDELEGEAPTSSEREQVWRRMEQLRQESLHEMAQFLADCSHNIGLSGVFGRTTDFHEAGWRWLAEEPEFDGDNLKNILKCFDSLDDDFNEFFSDLDEDVEIFIGQENPIKYLRDYSLVITGFTQDDSRGILGILGPKRMNYQKNRFVLKEVKKKIKK
ncbi:MAG: Transcriptional regulator of heat shock protein [Parcubacteria group bacterium GW2011_GWC2_42_6]|nr:MAG: Transcriptional regulator of heat shock protein [Parcubacteria group bacterium GW2011_GWC2_42_6]KKT76711.1 MAG: Transcriptional regulator of heat shock protein [Parcubacteria group bacterium GW2011_GWF2_44_7]